MAVPITCAKCGYEWEYSGDLYHTTCPRCNHKTPTPYRDAEGDVEDALDDGDGVEDEDPDPGLADLRERRADLIAELSEVQAEIEARE